jgi:hypothetical protein
MIGWRNVCTQCELRISRILRFSASLLDKGKATDEAGEELSCAPYLEKVIRAHIRKIYYNSSLDWALGGRLPPLMRAFQKERPIGPRRCAGQDIVKGQMEARCA